MKALHDICDEYLEKNFLSQQTLRDLIWHIENDPEPQESISMATDMGLKQLGRYIAKHLDHKDEYVREFVIGCVIGRLQLLDYVGKAFKMAKDDPYENVRDLAIFNIGEILPQLDNKDLQREIAQYLYQLIIDPNKYGNDLFKHSAYNSILAALGVHPLDRPSVPRFDINQDIDLKMVEKFKKEYGI